MQNLFHTFQDYQDFARLVALEVVALTRPVEDLISRRQAFAEFGRAWIKDRTARGLLAPRRSGAGATCAILYSRAECTALLSTERTIKATIKEKQQ